MTSHKTCPPATFVIMDFPLAVSFIGIKLAGIEFGWNKIWTRKSIIPFYLQFHFSTAMDITKGHPMGSDPAQL